MNSDDSIRIALDVICEPIWFDWKNQTCRETIVRFIKEIYEAGRADEREACARFVEEGYVRQFENPWREDLAAAIRTRGYK